VCNKYDKYSVNIRVVIEDKIMKRNNSVCLVLLFVSICNVCGVKSFLQSIVPCIAKKSRAVEELQDALTAQIESIGLYSLESPEGRETYDERYKRYENGKRQAFVKNFTQKINNFLNDKGGLHDLRLFLRANNFRKLEVRGSFFLAKLNALDRLREYYLCNPKCKDEVAATRVCNTIALITDYLRK